MKVLPDYSSLFQIRFSFQRLFLVWSGVIVSVGALTLWSEWMGSVLPVAKAAAGIGMLLIGFILPSHVMLRLAATSTLLPVAREIFLTRSRYGSDVDDFGVAIFFGAVLGACFGLVTRPNITYIPMSIRVLAPIFAAVFGKKNWPRFLGRTRRFARVLWRKFGLY